MLAAVDVAEVVEVVAVVAVVGAAERVGIGVPNSDDVAGVEILSKKFVPKLPLGCTQYV